VVSDSYFIIIIIIFMSFLIKKKIYFCIKFKITKNCKIYIHRYALTTTKT
jgi:hypothetical protein